jgi:hypothetical protein
MRCCTSLLYGTICLVTTIYLVQHGDKERLPGDPGLTELGGSGPVAVVSHGGVTVDLLRNLLGDDGLPPRLVEDHIPPCAITTFDGLHVIGIPATSHLIDRLLSATEVRRARSGPGLWPGPCRQARWVGRGLRRSRVGPEDRFCEAVRNDLGVPLTLEGPTRTMCGGPGRWP